MNEAVERAVGNSLKRARSEKASPQFMRGTKRGFMQCGSSEEIRRNAKAFRLFIFRL